MPCRFPAGPVSTAFPPVHHLLPYSLIEAMPGFLREESANRLRSGQTVSVHAAWGDSFSAAFPSVEVAEEPPGSAPALREACHESFFCRCPVFPLPHTHLSARFVYPVFLRSFLQHGQR